MSILQSVPRYLPPVITQKLRKAYHLSRFAPNSRLISMLKGRLTKTDGFYVELGANDGVRLSNTLFLERMGWSGVLIEPIPHSYFQCRNYRSNRNTIVCAACVPRNYPFEYVGMAYGDLMTTSQSLILDLPSVEQHLMSSKRFLRSGENLIHFGAKAKSLQDILDENGAPDHIDFLSLDVEGAEIPVLEGVDFTKTEFGLILVESRDFTLMKNFLSDRDYSLEAQVGPNDLLFSRYSS